MIFIVSVVVFIFFHLFLFFVGRGFLIFFHKILKKEFNEDATFLNLQIYYFYPLISLFVIGNFSLTINFFTGVSNLFVYYALFFVAFNIFKKFTFHKKYLFYIYSLIIPFILASSTYGINFAQDAGHYHLNTQNWIRSDQIHAGLSNLNIRYGYSSFFDYISSNFWFDNNFTFLHFTNLIFLVLFFIFLFNNLINHKNSVIGKASLFIVIFGVLDNFGVGGGRNGYIDIEAVTKSDTPFAILFFLTFIFIADQLVNKKYNFFESTFAFYLIIFAVQMRILGFLLIPLYIYFLYVSRKSKDFKISKLSLLINSIIFSLWTLKNIIISGCLIFPVEQTCFSRLSWYSEDSAKLENLDLSSFHISYSLDQNIIVWFQEWITKPINYSASINFIFSLLVILFISFLIYGFDNQNLQIKLMLFVFLMLSLFLWIISLPAIRFGTGIFLSIVSYIGVLSHDLEIRNFLNQKIFSSFFIFLFFISFALTIRIDSYSNFLNNFGQIYNLEPTEVSYIDNRFGWGVVPELNSSCWINIECIPEEKSVSFSENIVNVFYLLDQKK